MTSLDNLVILGVKHVPYAVLIQRKQKSAESDKWAESYEYLYTDDPF